MRLVCFATNVCYHCLVVRYLVLCLRRLYLHRLSRCYPGHRDIGGHLLSNRYNRRNMAVAAWAESGKHRRHAENAGSAVYGRDG